MQKEIPLFQKVYDFYNFYYEQSDHLPKKAKAVLGRKIEINILELLETISKAANITGDKSKHLLVASEYIDQLKVLFRLCYEVKAIDQAKYIAFEEKLQEIGQMTGGWIKSVS
jgi:hypothetical protein